MTSNDTENQTAVLAGGCFWCTEAIFSHVKGVQSVIPGYTGGSKNNPTYEEVSNETTGHAETVQIKFDPNLIAYEKIVEIFFATHDPTTINRQGGDVGEQYRSAIFYQNEEQRQTALAIKNQLGNDGIYSNPIVTQILPAETFYPAEEYHHNYFEKNPDQQYCQVIISPKIAKFRAKYQDYIKE